MAPFAAHKRAPTGYLMPFRAISLDPKRSPNPCAHPTTLKTIASSNDNQSIKTRDAQPSLGHPDKRLRCDVRPSTPVICNAEQ